MTEWIVLIAACIATGAFTFCAARFGVATFRQPAIINPGPRPQPQPAPPPAIAPPRRPPSEGRRNVQPRPPPLASLPEPTVAAPPEEKLELWARQIEAGTRKMSMATDGCRVTWNRSCKHGHPTWLVHLGLLSPE